jgi:hypothetical protein
VACWIPSWLIECRARRPAAHAPGSVGLIRLDESVGFPPSSNAPVANSHLVARVCGGLLRGAGMARAFGHGRTDPGTAVHGMTRRTGGLPLVAGVLRERSVAGATSRQPSGGGCAGGPRISRTGHAQRERRRFSRGQRTRINPRQDGGFIGAARSRPRCRLRRAPGDFSPSVLLRSLVQDTLSNRMLRRRPQRVGLPASCGRVFHLAFRCRPSIEPPPRFDSAPRSFLRGTTCSSAARADEAASTSCSESVPPGVEALQTPDTRWPIE